MKISNSMMVGLIAALATPLAQALEFECEKVKLDLGCKAIIGKICKSKTSAVVSGSAAQINASLDAAKADCLTAATMSLETIAADGRAYCKAKPACPYMNPAINSGSSSQARLDIGAGAASMMYTAALVHRRMESYFISCAASALIRCYDLLNPPPPPISPTTTSMYLAD